MSYMTNKFHDDISNTKFFTQCCSYCHTHTFGKYFTFWSGTLPAVKIFQPTPIGTDPWHVPSAVHAKVLPQILSRDL